MRHRHEPYEGVSTRNEHDATDAIVVAYCYMDTAWVFYKTGKHVYFQLAHREEVS